MAITQESRGITRYESVTEVIEVDKSEWDLLKKGVDEMIVPTKWYTRFVSGAYSVAVTAILSLIPYFIQIVGTKGVFSDKIKSNMHNVYAIVVTFLIAGIAFVFAVLCSHIKKDRDNLDLKSKQSIQTLIRTIDDKISKPV